PPAFRPGRRRARDPGTAMLYLAGPGRNPRPAGRRTTIRATRAWLRLLYPLRVYSGAVLGRSPSKRHKRASTLAGPAPAGRTPFRSGSTTMPERAPRLLL